MNNKIRLGIFCLFLNLINSNIFANNNILFNNKEFLLLKKETITSNLENINSLNYIPKDVIILKEEGIKIVPRSNPFIKIYNPNHPKSDKYGFILRPNINEQKEREELSQIEKRLKQL